MVVINNQRISILKEAIGDTSALSSRTPVEMVTALTCSNVDFVIQVENLVTELEACKLEVVVLKCVATTSQPTTQLN